MSCKCDSCEHNRNIDVYRGLQPERRVKKLCKVVRKNPPSKKHLMDRYNSARKSLMQDIEWYIRGRQHGYTDSWFYGRLKRNSWVVEKYREARANLKQAGITPPSRSTK